MLERDQVLTRGIADTDMGCFGTIDPLRHRCQEVAPIHGLRVQAVTKWAGRINALTEARSIADLDTPGP